MKKWSPIREIMMVVIFLILAIIPFSAPAQYGFLVSQCQTEEEVLAMIDTVLLYNVDSSFRQNLSFTGDPKSVGYYTNGGIFGFDNTSGIVISTGFSGSLDASNNCSGSNANGNTGGGGDPDLMDMTSMQIYDAVIIEFDIKRLDDSVFLSYIFGSEEYHEWVNSQFNDVFGFFLSGPGIEGPYINDAVNIATIPGTNNPVSINTINCGKAGPGCNIPLGSGPNCELLYDNTDNGQSIFNQCALDAFTYPLTAAHEIQPGEWYHVKLALGDVGDAVYDSGILLEKGSIVSNPFDFHVLPCETAEDVTNIVDTVLLSNVADVNKKNIEFNGDPKAVGYFYNGDFLGLEQNTGIILSTGLADEADGPNKCNTGANASNNTGGADEEPDLKQLSVGESIYDVATIEFDFVPSIDSVKLNYVFASEEYHELVNWGSNDVFGIFLSGPGIDGEYSNNAINLGLVPGTAEPVNAGTVNFGEGGPTCSGKPDSCFNCIYLNDNSQSDDTAFYFLVYDGYTTALDAPAGIQSGQWYHVKISIGDVGVSAYDSGILLSGGTISGDTVITERPEKYAADWCRIVPNPAGNYLNLKIREKNAFMKILNLDGRLVLEQQLMEGSNMISISSLSPGTYIINVASGNKVHREKLIHY